MLKDHVLPQRFIDRTRSLGMSDDEIVEMWYMTYGPGGAWDHLVEYTDDGVPMIKNSDDGVRFDQLVEWMLKRVASGNKKQGNEET